MAWTRGPKPPDRDPERQVRAGRHPARRAEQPVYLILRHYGSDRWHLGHLMAVRLGIVALQGVLTPVTLPGLDRNHNIHLLDRNQRPALPPMARLAPALAATGPTAWTWPQGVRRIARRRPRGVVRGLVQAFQQLLDGGFERGNTCFEGADILADGNGGLLPQLRWERWCSVHGPQSYAGWIPTSKSHVLRPRERLRF
jgi:hypothetical protein